MYCSKCILLWMRIDEILIWMSHAEKSYSQLDTIQEMCKRTTQLDLQNIHKVDKNYSDDNYKK